LKARFWFGLEVNPRNLCVTGTFTQQRLSPSRPQVSPGTTRARRHGDGLKRRDRQSSCLRPASASASLHQPPRVRQDSAACVSLSSIYLSKSKTIQTSPHPRQTSPAQARPFARRDEASALASQVNRLGSSLKLSARPRLASQQRRGVGRYVAPTAPLVNPFSCFFRETRPALKTVTQKPQIAPRYPRQMRFARGDP
jgi:hypothetical protein